MQDPAREQHGPISTLMKEHVKKARQIHFKDTHLRASKVLQRCLSSVHMVFIFSSISSAIIIQVISAIPLLSFTNKQLS